MLIDISGVAPASDWLLFCHVSSDGAWPLPAYIGVIHPGQGLDFLTNGCEVSEQESVLYLRSDGTLKITPIDMAHLARNRNCLNRHIGRKLGGKPQKPRYGYQ